MSAETQVPYAPFGKGDRLGRAADFTASAYYQQKQKYRREREGRDRGDDFRNDDFQYKYIRGVVIKAVSRRVSAMLSRRASRGD